jgi:hypothetical protein
MAGGAMTIRNYADLIAWQKAMTLAESVYKTTHRMPRDERFGRSGPDSESADENREESDSSESMKE